MPARYTTERQMLNRPITGNPDRDSRLARPHAFALAAAFLAVVALRPAPCEAHICCGCSTAGVSVSNANPDPGEEITITRHGRPVAVVLRPGALRSRRAEQVIGRAREVAELVSAARGRPLPEAALSEEHAREWVDAVRADRNR